ncbi:MAG TPA: DUF4432 family protein [Anaerolineae bacterium]|nr:DUF4432 family protein [Anaerolineae bacterium]
MARLFGREWSRKELQERVGRMEQLAGVRLSVLSDGPERGVRIADITTGSGFAFTVLIDRGMDIGPASFNGRALAWQSSTGAVGPWFYQPEEYEWLYGFHGGLLVTCGLTAAGAPSQDEDGTHGLHGRISNLPAFQVNTGSRWVGDDYEVWIKGQVRETSVFGHDLLLTRIITARLGESRLLVEDVVENVGFKRSPLMVLYHCNFGFPVVDEGSELVVNDQSVRPRDEVAAPGLSTHAAFEKPQAEYAEQVFYHDPIPDEEGFCTAAIVNRALDGGEGLAAYVRYRKAELPNLIEWKQMGVRDYVVGLEPANCLPEGRLAERTRGTLQFLAPGERREFHLELGAVTGEEAIAALG